MHRTTGLLVLLGLLAGCSAAGPAQDAASPAATATVVPRESAGTTAPDPRPSARPSPSPQRRSLDDPALADAVFLTAVERVLEGTAYAGIADDDPGALLRTATQLCERLADGEEAVDLLLEYVLLLAEAGGGTNVDQAYLGGALLGAGVHTYCPEHAEALTWDTEAQS